MPDVSISDDQRERLQRVQDHLAEDVAYGHVRPRDAVEYLLDQFEDDSFAESPRPTSESTAETEGDDAGFEVRNGGASTDGAQASVVSERDTTTEDPATDEAEAESTPSGATDETRLSSVMSLLDDHEDVWREAAGGEEKYEVDLPDGGTERARTKDDVRAVLFKHYR